MSSEDALSPIQQAQVQANATAVAEVLLKVVPQAFTSQNIADQGVGEIDEWKLAIIKSRALPSLVYLDKRGEEVKFYKGFVNKVLRGSHSVDGKGLMLLRDIAIGITGGGGKKNLMKKPGWVGRNITKRDWKDRAKRENSQVIE